MRAQVERLANAVQTLALHNLGAGRGKESLVFFRITVIEVGCHHAIEHGIAQILEPLIVHPVPVVVFHRHGAVHQCQLIIGNVAWQEAGNAVYKNIKLLILGEKELYYGYEIIKHREKEFNY